MKYAIPFSKNIPPEYWLFNDLFYQEYNNTEFKPMKRKRLSHSKSNRNFKRGMRTQRKNVTPPPSRGGYRL